MAVLPGWELVNIAKAPRRRLFAPPDGCEYAIYLLWIAMGLGE